MKIVFIVHYFPPINSSGTRRVLALSKYLTKFGHDVTVVTTAKRGFDGPPIEPMPSYCRVLEIGKSDYRSSEPTGGNTRDIKSGRTGLMWYLILFRRALTVIFGQLIDHRIFFASRFRNSRLPDDVIKALSTSDIIISSCPPWPVHLAGYYVAKNFSKPWIADYRDHFSGYHFISGNRISSFFETWMDRKMLSRAAAVTAISSPMSEYYGQFHNRVVTIENGYDAEYIDEVRSHVGAREPESGKAIVRYLGSITRDRVPRVLFAVLKKLDEQERGRIIFEIYGEAQILKSAIATECPELSGCFRFIDRVSYSRSIELMLSADALLLMETSSNESLSTQGTLTTKLFEYLAAERPILAEISPKTLIGQVIAGSGLGLVISCDETEIRKAVLRIIRRDTKVNPNETFIRSYSREIQARRFENLFQSVLNEKTWVKRNA
ncbi:MAG: hypothetical protein EOP04_05460 [Proteobacteria bacterium]|nr:MAG: hypothetical protein EOP04_05460 [Pseudomonadota bacterium]